MAGFITEGFRNLAALIPDIVGVPAEDEHWESNGDSLQQTSAGLMVYRKATNTPGFTDGSHSWVLGPNGLQDRDNNVLFDWEKTKPEYRPSILYMPTPSETFLLPRTVRGYAVHGTRSGVDRSVVLEFPGAASYETTRTDGISANCTVGDDTVALHIPWTRWGWHAFSASPYYISLELVQGLEIDEITDGQVRTACWVVQQSREVRPDIPLRFRSHAELEHDGETIRTSGKTDVFSYGSPRMEELRARIMARLTELGVA